MKALLVFAIVILLLVAWIGKLEAGWKQKYLEVEK